MSWAQDPQGIRYAIWILLFFFLVSVLVLIYICCEVGGRAVPIMEPPKVSVKASEPQARTLAEPTNDEKDADNAAYIDFTMKSVF